MNTNIRRHNFRTIKATLLAALLLVASSIALLAQSPIQKPPTLELKPIGFSNAVTRTKNFQMQVTPTDLTDADNGARATGTGTLRLTGTLSNVSGCCARIKLVIIRQQGASVQTFEERPFEFCGSQQVNISKALNASTDDARFRVGMTNLDAWNKVAVNGNFTPTCPTADVILTAQPNIPIDLTRGVDVSRTFRLNPNTAGSLKIEIRWAGSASLQARPFKPGQQAGPAGGVLTQTAATGALDLNYDITAADIAAGDQWAVNVLNNSSSSQTATGITFRVIYTLEE
jgi:hypothetical protein